MSRKGARSNKRRPTYYHLLVIAHRHVNVLNLHLVCQVMNVHADGGLCRLVNFLSKALPEAGLGLPDCPPNGNFGCLYVEHQLQLELCKTD